MDQNLNARLSRVGSPISLIAVSGVRCPLSLTWRGVGQISLVVMVGDEYVLGHDPTWNALLKKCKEIGAFVPSEQVDGDGVAVDSDADADAAADAYGSVNPCVHPVCASHPVCAYGGVISCVHSMCECRLCRVCVRQYPVCGSHSISCVFGAVVFGCAAQACAVNLLMCFERLLLAVTLSRRYNLSLYSVTICEMLVFLCRCVLFNSNIVSLTHLLRDVDCCNCWSECCKVLVSCWVDWNFYNYCFSFSL